MKLLIPFQLILPLVLCVPGEALASSELAGGKTTVRAEDRNAFSHPASNLSLDRRDGFFVGRSFFRNPWVKAPTSTTARDGLGPLFNTNSCMGCHHRNGRGQPVREGMDHPPRTNALILRLSVEGGPGPGMGVRPEPVYGTQLSEKSLLGIPAEGRIVYRTETVRGRYADDTPYTLSRPILSVEDLAYGPLDETVRLSPRVPPALIGLGLLEAISEQDILSAADPEDKEGDGISGRPNRVWDRQKQASVLGRFGWKANEPTLRQQVAAAFNGDIGITSSLYPDESCTSVQEACRKAPDGGHPEINDELLGYVTFYSSTLAVPARRKVDASEPGQGESLFHQAGCAACHRPSYVTGDHQIPELAGQRIYPYTDLLLHDMGEGLADHRRDFEASGREWRTPPLWGIGLVETVNGHSRLLHDGRASNLTEAILWHGGEAEVAKQAFKAFSKAERTALIRFVESI